MAIAMPYADLSERAVIDNNSSLDNSSREIEAAAFEELKKYFNTAQIVELTAMIAFESLRARFNRALHIESHGFCQLPADHLIRKAVPPWQSL